MTGEELIDRVRDELGDYGDIENTAAADFTANVATDDTELSVDDATVFDTGDWLYAKYEAMEVKSSVGTPSNVVTVRRGMRGTTAEAHLLDDVVRSNLRFGNAMVLRAINSALAGAYPLLFKVVEDTSLTVVEGQALYELANPVRDIRSVWLETQAGSGEYELCRLAVPLTRESFNLYGSWSAGIGIKVIAITTFDRIEQYVEAGEPPVTVGGSLDAEFPDDDEAYDYLVKDAAGRLLLKLAGSESANEGAPARGAQAQDTRYVLINAAKALRSDARESLRKARMQAPVRIAARPDARYF